MPEPEKCPDCGAEVFGRFVSGARRNGVRMSCGRECIDCEGEWTWRTRTYACYERQLATAKARIGELEASNATAQRHISDAHERINKAELLLGQAEEFARINGMARSLDEAEVKRLSSCPWCGAELERIPTDDGDELGCSRPECPSAGHGVWCYAEYLHTKTANWQAQAERLAKAMPPQTSLKNLAHFLDQCDDCAANANTREAKQNLRAWADAIDAALSQYGVFKMGFTREGPSEVERLRQELIEWQSECFYQFAVLDTVGKHKGWYNARCRSTLERLGKALVAASVLERHPDGGEWYRPVKAKE